MFIKGNIAKLKIIFFVLIVLITTLFSFANAAEISIYPKWIDIHFANGVSIRMDKSIKNHIKGISSVRVDNVFLRNPSSPPIRPLLKTTDETSYSYCQYSGYEKKKDIVIIHTVLYVKGTIQTDKLDWIFAPYQDKFRGRKIKGVEYGYKFISQTRKLEQIIDRSTWELDGNVTGNTYIECGETGFIDFCGCKKSSFATRPFFQFGCMQGFSFQCNKTGVLFTFFSKPSLIKSRMEKVSNTEWMHYYDFFYVEPAFKAELPRKFIAYYPKNGLENLQKFDEWALVYDYTGNYYRNLYGIKEVTPVPIVRLLRGGRFKNLYQITEFISRIKKLNYKAIWIGLSWINDEIENVGQHRSCNATWDFEISPGYGGTEGLKALCDEAHKQGIKIIHWLAGYHMSAVGTVARKHPEWICRTKSGSPDYITFAFRDMVMMNMKSPFRNYCIEKLKTLHDLTGVDGLWIDSWSRGVPCINYLKKGGYTFHVEEMMKMQAELQKVGYKSLFLEGWGPYGLPSRTHSYLQKGGHTYYKTAWYYNPGLNTAQDTKPNYYYKYIANKATPILAYIAYDDFPHNKNKGYGIIEHPKLMEQIRRANHDYNIVMDKMEIRTLIPSPNNPNMEIGVEWRNSEDTDVVIFAYQPFKYQLKGGEDILDITDNKKISPKGGNAFTTLAEHTYLIKREKRQ